MTATVRRALPIAALAAAACAGSPKCGDNVVCEVVEHVLLDLGHPWHSVPGFAASIVVAVPLFVAALPVALLETGGETTRSCDTVNVCLGIALVPGVIVGSAFFVALYPLEWVFAPSEGVRVVEAPPPADG